jgi:ribose transport system permease protein
MNKNRWQGFTRRNPYLFSLLLLVIVMLVNFYFQPNLFDRSTLNGNMRVFLPLILLAAGQTIVLLCGGIDISVGSIVSIINVILATQVGMQGSPQKMVQMMFLCLFVGMAAGAVNGFFVAYMRLQPIITTYATSFLYAGLALFILPNPGGGIPEPFSTFYREATPLGLPLAFFIIAIILLTWGLIQQTRYGRYLFAVGGKPESAYETAVPVSFVQFSTYVVSG